MPRRHHSTTPTALRDAPMITPAEPRFVTLMAPGWAVYGITVFILSALTGIVGWMGQRGIRLIWGILVAMGLGAQIGALGLYSHERAWGNRMRKAGYANAPRVATMRQRVRRGILGLVIAGCATIAGGVIGAIRTSGKPTMS